MTRQEIAVALSHIEVWRLIASGDVPSALVLEDDVFLPIGFAAGIDRTWAALVGPESERYEFDLLYLSFKEVGERIETVGPGPHRRTRQGIWQASGYVLTREGAQKLLDQLPAHGPVDLWLNKQFANLRVYTAERCIIEQSIDEPSTNSYSVLPVLSQVGVITREKPLIPATRRLRGPVVVLGDQGTGLTALAKALSMLGYTCCNDLEVLPGREQNKLVRGHKGRLFNAYVNIGSIDEDVVEAIANSNRDALFIVTSREHSLPNLSPDRVLHLRDTPTDKWEALTAFVKLDYPSFPYPDDPDLGRRPTATRSVPASNPRANNLRFDKSPWILQADADTWQGISFQQTTPPAKTHRQQISWQPGRPLSPEAWNLRTDTFPSNMAVFTAANFNESASSSASLTLQEEVTAVRNLTSAAIASNHSYLYGRFSAALRPPAVSGLITGLFLHRNGPRQEIDIEFLGKDTTKMLINVYYNPGPEGTKLEYGYRGTPTLIDLGFDAAEEFHTYEIDWQPNSIRWLVDQKVVYERADWNPTPIPDQPLELNVNLWHSRSTEFAGRLAPGSLPAAAELKAIEIHTR